MTDLNDHTPLKKPTFKYYKSIFDKYDKNKDGFISVEELQQIIESREYDNDIPSHVVERIHKLHDANQDKQLDFTEFVDMINNPGLSHIFGHYVNRYIQWVVPKLPDHSRTVTDGEYEDEYSCYPPAVGMIIISLVEIIFFCIDEAMHYQSSKTASGPTAQLFIYDPYNRQEVWRFLTYMFVHIGAFHLVLNLLVQIMLGIPLEMIHKWWRVLIVYFAGVLAGSLGTSIVDPTVKLAGASGGVYSLLTAHIASIIMNWKEMSLPFVQLMIFVIVAVSDIGTAIYNRYYLNLDQNIGYAAHFAGALAGLLVGLNILRNLNVTKTEKYVWYISLIAYIVLMGTCIIWNLAWPQYFPKMTVRGSILMPFKNANSTT